VIVLWVTGHPFLVGIAIAAVVLNLWSHGVMHNYAMNSAKARHDMIRQNMVADGVSQDELDRHDMTPIKPDHRDAETAPDWFVWVSLLAQLGGVVLLIVGIVIRVW
jgi:hypothetical protein